MDRDAVSVEVLRTISTNPDIKPGPKLLLLTMVINFGDGIGRGMFPSQATLAKYLDRSLNQIGRDMRSLHRMGLLKRGDQSKSHRLPPQRRPTVWDITIDVPDSAPAEPVEAAPVRQQRKAPKPRVEDLQPGTMKSEEFLRLLAAARSAGTDATEEQVRRMSDIQLDELQLALDNFEIKSRRGQ